VDLPAHRLLAGRARKEHSSVTASSTIVDHPTTYPLDFALDLFVPGKPAPQGSKRHVGGGVMVESSKAVAPWRTTVAWHAAQAYRVAPLDGAVWVSLLFVMPRPAATPKRSTPQAVKRPDLDKLTRAVFDALSGVVWRDDSQVVQLVASKRLASLEEQPGVNIRVRQS
jgi:crossover junction endodeoxyribonuclease RusA